MSNAPTSDTDEFVILEDDEFVVLCDAPVTPTVCAGPPAGPTTVNVWHRCGGNVRGIKGTGAPAGTFVPAGAYAGTKPATWKSQATAEAYAERIRAAYAGAKYGCDRIRVSVLRAAERAAKLYRIRQIDAALAEAPPANASPGLVRRWEEASAKLREERARLSAPEPSVHPGAQA